MMRAAPMGWPALIAQLMVMHGVSQRRFAEETGIHRLTFRRWLRGKAGMTITQLETMLDYFGYDLDAIQKGEA